MPPLSTGGPASSRSFTVKQMERALMNLPTSQRHDVRRFIRILDDETEMGYYAAMELVAHLGLFLMEKPTSCLCNKQFTS